MPSQTLVQEPVLTMENRLDKIEEKIDKLTDAMVSIARAEEKLQNMEKNWQTNYERMNRFSQKLDDIEDTVKGTVLAMESDLAAGEIFHIGSSQEISIEELIKAVGQMMNYAGEYIEAPTYPGSVSRRCPDISKAKRLLDYNPQIDWKVGLKNTVEWYKDYFLKNKTAKEDGFKEQEKFNY